jgi:hypothetical protein
MEKCEMYGGCWNPPAKEKPLSPSDATDCSGSSRLTDVETKLLKMAEALSRAGVTSGATALRLAADIVRSSGKQAVALRDAQELFGEIMRDEVNHQDEAEKWLRAYGQNSPITGATASGASQSSNRPPCFLNFRKP